MEEPVEAKQRENLSVAHERRLMSIDMAVDNIGNLFQVGDC